MRIQYVSWTLQIERGREMFKQIHSVGTAMAMCMRMLWDHRKGYAKAFVGYSTISSLAKLDLN